MTSTTPSTPSTPSTDPSILVRTMRRGAVGLAVLSVLATAYELATERHWSSVVQLIPWVTLLGLAVAIVLAARGRPRSVALARLLAGLALVSSLFGMYRHAAENRDAGALDSTYSQSWETRSPMSQWYLAVTKSVGPTPPLAPGVLGQSALLVLLSTVGLGRTVTGPGPRPSRTWAGRQIVRPSRRCG